VVGVTTFTFSTSDEDLEAFLDDAENKSETIREALRVYQFHQEGVEDDRLSERQRIGYEWMLETAGAGGTVALDVIETTLAQLLSVKKSLIRRLVVKPLDRLGYVDVRPRMESVAVRVRSPEAVDGSEGVSDGDGSPPATERMEEILSADVAEVSE